MKNGVVVVEHGRQIPEGADVRVEFVCSAGERPLLDDSGQTLGQKLMKYAGKAEGLPVDAAANHDHYLYGSTKQ